MEPWKKELADAILYAIAQMGITYDKDPVFRICVGLFDLAYPSDLFSAGRARGCAIENGAISKSADLCERKAGKEKTPLTPMV